MNGTEIELASFFLEEKWVSEALLFRTRRRLWQSEERLIATKQNVLLLIFFLTDPVKPLGQYCTM